MTPGAALLPLAWLTPALLRARQLALAAAGWIVAANIWTGGPLFAFWVGSHSQTSGNPSMTALVVVVAVLATVNYGLVALLRAIARAQDRFDAVPDVDGTRLPWLYRPRSPRRSGADTRAAGAHALIADRWAESPPAQTREPLVLIDGGTGAARPWRSVTPHLEFGFDVLAGVLPRDGSIDGTTRAMDRVGWQTAHIVARPRDTRAAVDLVRLGRARSLLILTSDAVADDGAVATEIAEFVVTRSAA